jgi:hypothetical protein
VFSVENELKDDFSFPFTVSTVLMASQVPPLNAVACFMRLEAAENKEVRLCLDEPSCSTAGSSGFRKQEMNNPTMSVPGGSVICW